MLKSAPGWGTAPTGNSRRCERPGTPQSSKPVPGCGSARTKCSRGVAAPPARGTTSLVAVPWSRHCACWQPWHNRHQSLRTAASDCHSDDNPATSPIDDSSFTSMIQHHDSRGHRATANSNRAAATVLAASPGDLHLRYVERREKWQLRHLILLPLKLTALNAGTP